MTIVRKRALSRNTPKIRQPDLFMWRPVPVLSAAPIAARKLAQRYGITMSHAIVVARLAGLGIETEARQ